MKRRQRRRNRKRGLKILMAYAEAAKEENPSLGRDQVANMVKADLENDFDDRPLLKFLLDLLAEFLPLILDGLFDND